MMPTPTCIVCDETNHLRQCGLYGGATISPAYICAAHDDPPRTICTGCDDAFREPAEELTPATFHRVEDHPRTICAGQYCHYCCERIIDMHRTGEIDDWSFDGPFSVWMHEPMVGDDPQ